MKTENLLLAPALALGLALIPAQELSAQSFTTLHTFTAYPVVTNLDGASPNGFLLSGNTLYGTAQFGGSSKRGTVFKLNTDGTGFTTLHSFAGSDGRQPRGELILSGNTLYGTTYSGGSSNYGTVFALNTDGTGNNDMKDVNHSRALAADAECARPRTQRPHHLRWHRTFLSPTEVRGVLTGNWVLMGDLPVIRFHTC